MLSGTSLKTVSAFTFDLRLVERLVCTDIVVKHMDCVSGVQVSICEVDSLPTICFHRRGRVELGRDRRFLGFAESGEFSVRWRFRQLKARLEVVDEVRRVS